MKIYRLKGLLAGMILIFAWAMPSGAYDLPALNLGFTSFVDGGLPSGTGLYVVQYLQNWSSDDFKDANGNNLLPPSAGEDLDAWISLTQIIYQSDSELMFGGKWGIDVIIPYVMLDLNYSNSGPFPVDNGSGIGDIWIGPYLQWDPIMGAGGPKFVQRVEFQFIFPTGKYDRNRELNPGSNFFSFNPYWSGTLFINQKLTASARIHYLWNAKNDEPNRGFAGAGKTQAGQAINANFAMDYTMVPNRFKVGINGYYLKQISDTKMDGNCVPGRKEQVLGIGPGFLYSFSQDAHLFFNSYYETAAENRPEGTRINFRFVYHF